MEGDGASEARKRYGVWCTVERKFSSGKGEEKENRGRSGERKLKSRESNMDVL